LSSPTAKTGGRIFTICTSNDAASPKDVPFEGFDEKKIVQVNKTTQKPKKVGVVRQFQAKRKKN